MNQGEMIVGFSVSLRDWMAGQALQGLCASNPDAEFDELVGWSYELADIAVKHRKD